ncbi:MAG: GAF domain-containing protein [Candidatus Omnitrophica bacterium]|nr:GAF domain-containing protein [Candidatus Omnitrophota bacterium]
MLLQNRRNIQNISYFVLNFFVALYSFGYFFWQFSSDATTAVAWFKILTVGIILLNNAYLFFVFVFVNILQTRKKLLVSCLFINIVFIALNFGNLLYTNLVPRYNLGFWPVPTRFFGIYLLFWFWQCLYGFYWLLKGEKAAEGRRKQQIRYFKVAAIIGFLGGATNWPMWYNIYIPPYTNILISFYIGIVAYAIVRHQLLDIEVIIRRAVVFAGLFAAIYGVFAFFTFLTQDIFQGITGGNRWFALIPSIFIITIALRPLESFLVNVTDKYLFQKKYDYKELLRAFADDVLSVMDLKKILNETINTLINTLRIENCGILLLNKDKNIYELTASKGIKNKNLTFDRESLLISYLERSKMHLEKNKHLQQMDDKGTIKEDMKKLETELVLPLVLHDSLIGAITLGRKKSGEPYTQDDLDILIPLSRSEAVAISNAQVMDDLSKTQAEAAQREKMAVIGTLASGINHEICNPLGIARGQCEVFLLNAKDGLYEKRSKEEQVYEAMRIMEKVIKETDRATAITKKLSSFAKPGTGDINEDVNIEQEVDEVNTLVGHELKLEKIDFVKEIPRNLTNIRADRKQIQEIFFNLIRNAGQAINERGRITVRAREEDKKVVIDIEDTGHGISEDRLGQIFNPFYTTKAPGKGTGLGLFIVKQVIQRNRGNISVKSKVGEGTTFTLEFPQPQYLKI